MPSRSPREAERDERALRESETRLRVVLAGARAGYWERDPSADAATWSPELFALFGLDPATTAPSFEGFVALIHPEDRERVRADFEAALARGGAFELEFRVQPSAGAELWVSSVGWVDLDAQGRPLLVRGINQDITARRNAEEALRASEASLRAALDQLRAREAELQLVADYAPVYLAHCDAEARFVFVNRAYAERFGLTPKDVIGRTIADVVGSVAYATVRPYVEEATSGRRVQFEIAIPYAHGTRHMHCTYVPETGVGKVGFVAVIQDVTEARVAREALRASEERLRVATDAVGLGIWTWDLETGRVRWENEGAHATFGIERRGEASDALEFFSDFVQPSDAARFELAITETLVSGSRFQFLGACPRPDGSVRWTELTGKLQRGADGAPIRLLGTAADATERIRGEEQVRLAAVQAARAAEANAKFRTMFEQGSQFAGILSLDGKVVECNRSSVEGCGFERGDIIGKPFWECGWWNGSAALMEVVRGACEAAAAGRSWRRELSYFVADGSERMLDLIVAPVTDDKGRVLFLAPTGTDTTDRRRAEDELRDADRRKDEFLATLAHELRNPLAPLRTGLEVLKLSSGDIAGEARARETMERQLGHMVRLIDDLLDLSRISRGKLELRKARVELRAVIENAVETSRPLIDAGRHTLNVELPSEPVWLDADLTRLAQVVSNVLSNAAKYTAEGGEIWLRAERDSDGATISVRDTGIGIPRTMLQKVFDMFSQVETDRERSRGGLGIGLALVKQLVEMHGGSVQAESDGAGQGSSFRIRLPLGAEPRALGDQEPSARAGAGPAKILVVDDNVDGAEMLATMLELAGHETRVARDGPEALEVAAGFQPRVVFLDIGLPGMSGYDVARALRAAPLGSSVLLVALTGWGSQEDKRRAKAAGFDLHLTKPVDATAIENVLARLDTAGGSG